MERDEQRLIAASEQLAEALRRMAIPSLKVAHSFEAEDDENGGWSTDIAEWKGHDVGIAMAVDKYTRAKGRAFWVGFWSKRYASIERLFEHLPRELRPRDPPLLNKDAEPRKDGGGTIYVLKKPLPTDRLGLPIAESYRGHYHYYGFYDPSPTLDIARTALFLESVTLAERTAHDDATTDVRLIERRTDISRTTKESLIQARRGQGKFRRGLETLWAACPISGLARRELLRASHIMPWRDANDNERLSKFNGILLSANLDALFDKHLISFKDDGTVMVSAKIPQGERNKLGLNETNPVKFKPQHKPYLEHHRDRFLKKAGNSKARGRRTS